MKPYCRSWPCKYPKMRYHWPVITIAEEVGHHYYGDTTVAAGLEFRLKLI